ncbi:MAG: beta-1,6-N-acetylglucosaminyltransferase [Bacteroidaceae bacterium]|nr:beta-1,6-N-acetylglucosaminyltransferase [Bacteroidaceae bacterium]
MKQAFLICAYNFPEYLERLIGSLDSERSNIYVHIDRKHESEFADTVRKYRDVGNVHFFSVSRNNYGGIGIVRSIAFLLGESLKCSDNGYFHVISGQDLLVRPLDELLDFFEAGREKNHLNFFELPYSKWTGNGGLDRFNYYYLNDILNCHDSRKLNYCLGRLFFKVQKFLGIRRKGLPFDKLYGGSAWFSVNRDAAALLDVFFSIEENWACIRHTYIPDEFIFHSVLCNSPLASTLVNDTYRYIDWTSLKISHPKTLQVEDFEKIVASGSFFARKIEPGKSRELIAKVERMNTNRRS